MFLINLGGQILDASQLMIVARTMGLGAAAVWSVSTKLFTLIYQLVTKVEGTAIVIFSEMMVRGEMPLLARRFRQVYQLTAGLAAVSLAVAVGINPYFTAAWAEPALVWPAGLGLLLAAVTYLNCVTRCHVDLVMHSKAIRGLRFVYFFEALGFVILAVAASGRIGFSGVLLPALLCAIVFRGIYTTRRTADYFAIPASTVSGFWLVRSLLVFTGLLPFALTTGWVAGLAVNPWIKLALAAAWTGIPAALALLTVALPRDVRAEFLGRLLPALRPPAPPGAA
jgi:O-antigen/teichoic acid export membrane protein